MSWPYCITVSVDLDSACSSFERISDVFEGRASEYMRKGMPEHANIVLTLAHLIRLGTHAAYTAPRPSLIIPNSGQIEAEEKE